MMKKLLMSLILGFYILCSTAFSFKLEKGDFLFQDLNCGAICDAITGVTVGYDGAHLSHVAMVARTGKHPLVIEAISEDVQEIPLKKFLNRSVDKAGHPRVMVGRLVKKYRSLIPAAIKQAEQWLGRPYNSGFTPNNHDQSFYCSQLILSAFKSANKGKVVFSGHNMSFNKPGSNEVLLAWKDYFHQLGEKVPQGEWGSNPGILSRSTKLQIIYIYGDISSLSTKGFGAQKSYP
jgi:hypothetical protein